MQEPTDKLSRLDSYRALPGALRNAVRLHLIYGVPGPEAMRLAGRGHNAARDWNQTRIQAVLTAYKALQTQTAYSEARPAAPSLPPGTYCTTVGCMQPATYCEAAGRFLCPTHAVPAPVAAPVEAFVPAVSPAPTPTSFPDRDPRCQHCHLVICACDRPVVLANDNKTGVDLSELFPHLTPENLSTWQQQAWEEKVTREAFVRFGGKDE